MMRCSEVASQCQDNEDNNKKDENLWSKKCHKDFPETCELAYEKITPSMPWLKFSMLLKSVWQFKQAQVRTQDFCTGKYLEYGIRYFVLLKDNVIGIHQKKNVEYYDRNALTLKRNISIRGYFYKYTENEYAILLQFSSLTLYINWKYISDVSSSFITFTSVTNFKMLKNVVYYVTNYKHLCKCEVVKGTIIYTTVTYITREAVAMSVLDQSLYILTNNHSIYKLAGKNLIPMVNYEFGNTNIYQELKKYNFLQEIDWQTHFYTYASLENNFNSVETTNKTFTAILSYSLLIFAGTNKGKLYIFKSSDINNFMDLYKFTPLKIFNFVPRYYPMSLKMYKIFQIGVVEDEKALKVYVAMPKKMSVVIFPMKDA